MVAEPGPAASNQEEATSSQIRSLLEHERAVYSSSGFGAHTKLGSRPALLVVDVTYGFVGRGRGDDRDVYPNWCGDRASDGVSAIAGVIEAARSVAVPIVYTTGSFSGLASGSRQLGRKHPRATMQPDDAYTIVDALVPGDGDTVIHKRAPSAFFGTPLITILLERGIDTLVLTGCSTSGCVRATTLDAFSLGFPIAIVREATFDRSIVGHEVALFEMDQKYADVVSEGAAIKYITTR